MEILNNYFKNLIFTYIEEKQGYAVYVAAISTYTSADEMKYVLAFVPSHLGIQNNCRLHELPWKNLQTRICPKSAYKVRAQHWKSPVNSIDISFKIVSRADKYSKYCVDNDKRRNKYDRNDSIDPTFPYEVLMVHNPKKHTVFQFPNKMNLDFTIDQFRTIFNYVGNNVYNPVINQTPLYQSPQISSGSVRPAQENFVLINNNFDSKEHINGNFELISDQNVQSGFGTFKNDKFQSPYGSEIGFVQGYFGDKQLHRSNNSKMSDNFGNPNNFTRGGTNFTTAETNAKAGDFQLL
jgi:hypothetical protein